LTSYFELRADKKSTGQRGRLRILALSQFASNGVQIAVTASAKVFLCIWLLLSAGSVRWAYCADQELPSKQPKPLSFDELRELATEDPPRGSVAEHLNQVLSEPVVDNHASLAGVRPSGPVTPSGRVLRVAEWNIERGLRFDDVQSSLEPAGPFEEQARKIHPSKTAQHRLASELSVFRSADVVVLDEVDRGVKRTEYRDVARSLAYALHFNYAYAVEFIELNRLYLAERKLDQSSAATRAHRDTSPLDPARYLGLEGTTILSRYPILSARVIRLPECYDWYHGEIEQISNLEQARRWSALKLFDERIRRQVRRGGRVALVAELAVPELTGGRVTVVAPHLENYCPPSCRRDQMDYLLRQLAGVSNTVIIAGDLNTTGQDATPTSIRREILKRITNPRFWAREALFWFIPVPFAGIVEIPLNYFKNFHDPTAINLPLLLSNHERLLFDHVRGFRFGDGSTFDFSGESRLSSHRKSHTLANSNQRSWKGFVPTFSFEKTYHHVIGSYKLDWFFIKPKGESAQVAGKPRCGHTLKRINTAIGKRISDHVPVTVDLPLNLAGQSSGTENACRY
jgi:endonuclease/exonuclease/phosphatase family metal-dependent hydrolase